MCGGPFGRQGRTHDLPLPPARRVDRMIAAQGLTKIYGQKTAVDGITFTVEPGRVTGFLGPNGAGKSTTMRMILGLDRPSAGRVTVNGRRYADLAQGIIEVAVAAPTDRGTATVRCVQTEDHPHRRRLAGAVRPDEASHLAGLDGERQIVHGYRGAVPLAQLAHLDGVHVRRRYGRQGGVSSPSGAVFRPPRELLPRGDAGRVGRGGQC